MNDCACLKCGRPLSIVHSDIATKTLHCAACASETNGQVRPCANCGKEIKVPIGVGEPICIDCVEYDPDRPLTILDHAYDLVHGDRRTAYGPVEESFDHIAAVWSVVLKTTVTPHQVALCMAGLKLCREANSHKQDNLIDLAAYAYLADLVVEKGGER